MGELTASDLEQWLTRGVLAARRGDFVMARHIFRALSRRAPAERRVWIGLARVAESAAEREEALRRAEVANVVLQSLPPDLHHRADKTALSTQQLFAAALSQDIDAFSPSPMVSDTAAIQPQQVISPQAFPQTQTVAPVTDHQTRRHGWWLLAVMLMLGGCLMFVLAGQLFETAPSIATPPTQSAIGPLPSPMLAQTAAVTVSVPTPSPPPPTPLPLPSPSPVPSTNPFGQFVAYDGWQIGLLRPDDVVVVDDALGLLESDGRLLIALIAVNNESSRERTLPAGLFSIEDDTGQRHYPLPGASLRYLDRFGRGLYGDLALEDQFTAQSGLRSVPLLFELPRQQTPVRLWVGDKGWQLR
ncbi:tetratricopeptide repeat-containing protein [Chloroflexus sp.]|uniref:tetratricopeptide repeat-containing protein n=1 Tax=Chloroflexus sp. TaxID=1904827 RepID=UPI002ADE3F32|nr:tetratricopeptide repeat-containing protein [Chloroflexus sp.]